MQKGVRIERWNHTSHILAMLHNASPNVETGKQPWQFNPYDPRFNKVAKPIRGDITDLICILPKEKRAAARKRARELKRQKKQRSGE